MSRKPVFTRETKGLNLRTHQWINTDTFEPMFGLQARVSNGVWAHVVVCNEVLFFTTREDALKHIHVLRERDAQS